jgi:hypothetical protein
MLSVPITTGNARRHRSTALAGGGEPFETPPVPREEIGLPKDVVRQLIELGLGQLGTGEST